MTTSSGISIFDADNHFYEPPEALTRHLPDQYRSQLQYVKLENGRTKLAVGGKISEYIPNPTFDVVARPGAQEEYYRKGNADIRVAALLGLGFLIGGYFGAVGAQHISELWLRRIFAITLIAVGGRMWFSR